MKGKKCCSSGPEASYQIEAIISIDERGQMVLPKETRAKVGIQAGDTELAEDGGEPGEERRAECEQQPGGLCVHVGWPVRHRDGDSSLRKYPMAARLTMQNAAPAANVAAAPQRCHSSPATALAANTARPPSKLNMP